MAKRHAVKVVVIHWRDANTSPVWLDDPNKAKLSNVLTAGLLAGEDEKVVRIALNRDEFGNWADIIAIPRSEIVKRQVVFQVEWGK